MKYIKKDKILKALKKTRFYFIGFLVLLVLMSIFYVSMRRVLLLHYQEYGTSLAKRYSAEVSGDLSLFRALIVYGANSIDYRAESGWTVGETEDWIKLYYERLQQVLGEDVLDPFVVYDGRIVGANPWSEDDTYEYSATEWYQKAVAADGEVIFTDIYTDAITGKEVLTIAQKCKSCDAVIAFDIFPENMELYNNKIELPEGAATYICDGNGVIIYCNTALKTSQSEIKEYLARIHAGFENGSLLAYDTHIVDPEGNRRGVYGTYIDINSEDIGWNVYITVPYNTILNQLNQFSVLFGLVAFPCILIIIFITVRNFRLGTKMDRANETIQVLGNQYYAIYRVNYEEDTYEMIKGSEYLRERLPKSGPYPQLLQVVGEVIEPAAFKDFCESFSSVSIRNLVSKQMRDYGGDFLRLFGEEYRWVSVRILFDKSLDTNEAVLCFREVDREKHQQFQERKLLQDALANSKRSEKTKQVFFSNMSHDMRTPLNAILSLADLTLQNADNPQRVQGYVEKIAYSGRQLLHLVNDILDMSRIEQGKVVLNNQSIDLEDCVQECASTFRLQAEAEKKQFIVECEVQDRLVMGDPDRISQVLNNLLSNAFKFTAEGDSISISVKQFDGMGRSQYQFIVKDTGMGMSEEFLPHLFEPYSRETRFSNRQISGTGLGMPIVKNLITEMSGQIRVDSKLGEGTVFTVTIPFAQTNGPSASANSRSRMELPSKEFSLKGRKILLAEDNVINMEIATEVLSMNGLEILQAWNGEEAVEVFKSSVPFEIDAVLMDMQMPKMDGCEAARHIRALPRPDAKDVPILAVTANAFAEDVAATSAAGMNDHISKPIDFNNLCAVLERLMEKRTS